MTKEETYTLWVAVIICGCIWCAAYKVIEHFL